MASFDQSQSGLAFANRRFSLDENPHAKQFDERAMKRHAWGKFFNQKKCDPAQQTGRARFCTKQRDRFIFANSSQFFGYAQIRTQ